MKRSFLISLFSSPWPVTAVFGLSLLFLVVVGEWRSTGTGTQVQVPMFYDAHYLFPRPWTQVQEVPGVPEPFPVAFYGPNSVSQTFVSGADNLTMIELWLKAPSEGYVIATLSDEGGPLYAGQIDLAQDVSGEYVQLSFPLIQVAEGRTFQLTLAAPEVSVDNPAVTHVIGGDRLGGLLRLNEYPRPGNLELRTYVQGTAVPDALAEQLLPDLFRQRLRQYKPPFLKGAWAAFLLVVLLGLSGLLLFLARPSTAKTKQVAGWFLAGILLAGQVWQIGSDRVQLSFLRQAVRLEAVTAVPDIISSGWRVANDLGAILWTAERFPEERFVSTELADQYPAIRVPADSALAYALDLPLNGRLSTGLQVSGEGSLLMRVEFNGEVLTQTAVTTASGPYWLDLDLTPWQGQSGTLRLVTEPLTGMPDGLWLIPQLLSKSDWLLAELPETAVPAGHRLGDDIVLLGYTVEPAQPQPNELVTVTLYWRGERPLSHNATVFIHALNEAGELIAQSDSQPVQNSYPLNTWPPGMVIADSHQFYWPTTDSLSQIAVGLYNPTTLIRFPVLNPDGMVDANDRALLPVQGNP